MKIRPLAISYFSIIRIFPLFIWIHRFVYSKVFDALLGLFLFPFCLLFFLFIRVRYHICKRKKFDLVGVSIVKNEGPYLEEFIEYYRFIGFDHLFIFDNDSSDNTVDILRRYEKLGFVTPGLVHGKGRQRDVYNIFLNRYGHRCKYFFVMDADEFLLPKSRPALNTIEQYFQLYENKKIGALGLNWVVFGTSGHKTKPRGAVTQSYVLRMPDSSRFSAHLKFVAKPSCVFSIYNPHAPYLWCSNYISCNGTLLEGSCHAPENDGIRVYHYFTKSEEEYLARVQKGNAWNGDALKQRERFQEIDSEAIEDRQMLAFTKSWAWLKNSNEKYGQIAPSEVKR